MKRRNEFKLIPFLFHFIAYQENLHRTGQCETERDRTVVIEWDNVHIQLTTDRTNERKRRKTFFRLWKTHMQIKTCASSSFWSLSHLLSSYFSQFYYTILFRMCLSYFHQWTKRKKCFFYFFFILRLCFNHFFFQLLFLTHEIQKHSVFHSNKLLTEKMIDRNNRLIGNNYLFDFFYALAVFHSPLGDD